MLVFPRGFAVRVPLYPRVRLDLAKMQYYETRAPEVN